MRIVTLIVLLISNVSISQWMQKGNDIVGESAESLSGVFTSMTEDGNTIIIGGHTNSGAGVFAGHVRIFEWDGSDWVQKGNDIDGEAAGDNFGVSADIAASGDVVAIGGYQNDGIGTDAGHVQVYEWNGSAWIQKGVDIEGQAPGDFTGLSCALSEDGNTLIVGDYYNDNTAILAGSARVFEWNGSAWIQKGVTLNGEAFGDNYGFSVDISDDAARVAIGSWANDDGGGGAGHTRVFEWSGSAWMQMGIDLDGDAAGDAAGHAVRLNSDGSILAVGAIGNDDSGTDAGHVKVYKWSGSAWTQNGSDLDGEAAGDGSGHSVALSDDGNRLIVGANKNDAVGFNSGHARVYDWTGTNWVQVGNDIDGAAPSDWFGKSVDISADGSTVVIGASNNDQGGTDAGVVQIYYYCSGGLDTSVTAAGMSLTANGTGLTFQWLDCDNALAPIPGETSSTFNPTFNGSFAVEVSDGICLDTSSCYQIGGIGIEEEFDYFNLYPNPAHEHIEIEGYTGESVRIYDGLGNISIRYRGVNGFSISDLAPGTYYLLLGTYVHRLIVY